MDPEELVHPTPHAQPEPSATSSSHVTHPNDAIMSTLEQITGQLLSTDAWWSEQFQTKDTRLTEHFQSVDEQFQVLDAKMEKVNIKVDTSPHHLANTMRRIKCCVTYIFLSVV
jgi:hypothetical protein